MPTKQFHELKATASMRPDVKKQMTMTPPIHAMSNSWFEYRDAPRRLLLLCIASVSACVGAGVELMVPTCFRDGLGHRETLGVLLSVGAVELNF